MRPHAQRRPNMWTLKCGLGMWPHQLDLSWGLYIRVKDELLKTHITIYILHWRVWCVDVCLLRTSHGSHQALNDRPIRVSWRSNRLYLWTTGSAWQVDYVTVPWPNSETLAIDSRINRPYLSPWNKVDLNVIRGPSKVIRNHAFGPDCIHLNFEMEYIKIIVIISLFQFITLCRRCNAVYTL